MQSGRAVHESDGVTRRRDRRARAGRSDRRQGLHAPPLVHGPGPPLERALSYQRRVRIRSIRGKASCSPGAHQSGGAACGCHPDPMVRAGRPDGARAGLLQGRCDRAGRGRRRGDRRERGGGRGTFVRARICRLDAGLRGRRVERPGPGEHGGDRGRAQDPDDDHVEPAGVDHDAGATLPRRHDARVDEGTCREGRRALAAYTHVDRLCASRGPRTADHAELGRPRRRLRRSDHRVPRERSARARRVLAAPHVGARSRATDDVSRGRPIRERGDAAHARGAGVRRGRERGAGRRVRPAPLPVDPRRGCAAIPAVNDGSEHSRRSHASRSADHRWQHVWL